MLPSQHIFLLYKIHHSCHYLFYIDFHHTYVKFQENKDCHLSHLPLYLQGLTVLVKVATQVFVKYVNICVNIGHTQKKQNRIRNYHDVSEHH